MPEAGHGKSFNGFPELIDPGPGNNFLHFAKELMGIIHPGYVLYPGNQVTGNHSIEIDGTDKVSFFVEQVKKKPKVKFCIKQESFIKEAPDTVLVIGHDCQWYRIGQFPAGDGYVITCQGKGGADPDHPLVVAQIVCDRKNEFI
jgi:hypothetical protein